MENERIISRWLFVFSVVFFVSLTWGQESLVVSRSTFLINGSDQTYSYNDIYYDNALSVIDKISSRINENNITGSEVYVNPLFKNRTNDKVTYVINLKKGWNLVSFPVFDVYIDENELKEIKIYHERPTFQNTNNVVYAPVNIKDVKPGVGYWIYSPRRLKIIVYGKPAYTIRLYLTSGKKMFIGGPYCKIKTNLSIFTYDPEKKKYLASDYFEPGKGYMISPTDNRVILLNCSGSLNFHSPPIMNRPCFPPNFIHGGMIVTENITLCPGEYRLPRGILVRGDNITIRCERTVLIGNRSSIGIDLFGRNNVGIYGCTFKNYSKGLNVLNSNNITIKNNTFINNSIGISGFLSYSTKIDNNTIINNTYGIGVSFFSNSTLKHNKVVLNRKGGIILYVGHYNNISNNNISENKGPGLTLKIIQNSVVENNTIQNNHGGLIIQEFSNNNRIQSNVFCDENLTNYDVYDEGNNSFHDNYCNIKYANNTVSSCEHLCNTSCFYPLNGMIITHNVTLCPGRYEYDKGIKVGSDNIKLTCNDTVFVGNGSNNGITNIGYDHVSIIGCWVENYTSGIYWFDGDYGQLKSNVLTNNENGLLLEKSDHSSVLNNTVPQNSFGGFIIENHNGTISMNKFINNENLGLMFSRSANYSLEDNMFNFNNNGLYINSSFNMTIIHNELMNNNENGLVFNNVESSLVTYNTITSNENGFLMINSSYNTITEGNLLEHNYLGLVLFDSKQNQIQRNSLIYNSQGIHLNLSEDNNIFGNMITHNSMGVYLDSSSHENTLSNNNLCVNDGSYDIYDEDSNVFSGNYCDENRVYTDGELTGCSNPCGLLSCVSPSSDSYVVNESTFICPGVYELPEGIYVNGSGNIILDCMGATIIGDGTGIGINNEGRNNVVIKNCIIKNYSIGIKSSSSSNITIVSNQLVQNAEGITFFETNNTNIVNNTFYNNINRSINLIRSYNSNIQSNIFLNGVYGISSVDLHTSTINQNQFINNNQSIFLDRSQSIIVENNIINNSYMGIDIIGGNSNKVIQNSISNNNIGIVINSINNSVMNNEITNNSNGIIVFSEARESNSNKIMRNSLVGINMTSILIYNSTNDTVAMNSIQNDENGIIIYLSKNGTIYDNYIGYNLKSGMYVLDSQYITLKNNDVSHSDIGLDHHNYGGVRIENSNHISFINNTVRYAGNVLNYRYNLGGVVLSNVQDSLIENNTVTDNGYLADCVIGYGLLLEEQSKNNTIKNNKIMNNNGYDLFIDDESCDNYIINNTGTNNDPILFYNESVILSNKNVSELVLCGADNSYVKNITIHHSNGILLINTQNITVENCNLSKGFIGLYMSKVNNSKITDNYITYNRRAGISFGVITDPYCCPCCSGYPSVPIFTNITVVNNTLLENNVGILGCRVFSSNISKNNISKLYGDYGEVAIFMGNIYNDVFDQNYIKNYTLGIHLSYGRYISINNNLLKQGREFPEMPSPYLVNPGYLTLIEMSVSNITNNTITQYNGKGIYIERSHWSLVKGNTISFTKCGIYDWGYDYDKLEENTLSNNTKGIVLAGLDNSIVQNNNVSDNGIGITIGHCINISVTNNSITHNTYGIHSMDFYEPLSGMPTPDVVISYNKIMNNSAVGLWMYSDYFKVVNNSFEHNNWSIYLLHEFSNVIANNTILNGTGYGIYLYDAYNNSVVNNVIMYNNLTGIYLNKSSPVARMGYQNSISNNVIMYNRHYGIFLDELSKGDNITSNIVCNNQDPNYDIYSVNGLDVNVTFSNNSCGENRMYYDGMTVSCDNPCCNTNGICEPARGESPENCEDC